MKTTAKKAISITLWMARGTATVLGLAVMLAAVFGVGTAALAAVPGDPFKLGRINTVGKITQLVGSADSAMLEIDNDSKGANATALDLQVNPTKPPMRVDSFTKVEKLNADLLDGQSADQFVPLGGKAFNSDNLDGRDSTSFANGIDGKANDADLLDGKDSTAFFSGRTYLGASDAVTGEGGGTPLTISGVPCDPGDNILSAGGSARLEDDMIEERPTSSTSWLVRVRDNGEPTTTQVVAICADFPPLH